VLTPSMAIARRILPLHEFQNKGASSIKLHSLLLEQL
jgi:hypothetical protein